ncbi:MAG: hypothetical protein M0P71_12030 [Melioribacteraceae bacterium]|jgi:hypothetical protein|nr:hypothetical protein [Melioribacteraceae bacterium]
MEITLKISDWFDNSDSKMTSEWREMMREIKKLEVKTLDLFSRIQGNNNLETGLAGNFEIF